MDCGERHFGEPGRSVRAVVDSAAAAAVRSCDSLLPCAGDGGEFVYRNGILFVFGCSQFRRLEAGDRRSAALLGVAGWPGGAGGSDLLRIDVAGGGEAASVSRKGAAQVALGVLDSVFHRRNTCGYCSIVQPAGTVLHDRVGAAVDLGSKTPDFL